MRRRILTVTSAAALFGLVAAPAVAQNSESAPAAAAPMKSRPKPKTPAGDAVTVRVINWRNADLVELQVADSGSANWKKVLGALKAGQWTSVKVRQGNNCRVDLRGKYADGQSADVSNVDVCADKTVNLTN
jgi:opacity protein-like surface antigen